MKKETQRRIILILSIIGLILCLAVLFPQVRVGIVNFMEQKLHREFMYHSAWIASLFSYAMGGICLLIFLNYCIQTDSGRRLVSSTKEGIKESLSGIDFRIFLKPVLWMFVVYALGILTIIRANYLYEDDILRTVVGSRGWHNYSRYVPEFLSIFVHANFRMTDISPVTQLMAALILAVSSVMLVYVLCDKKITVVTLLASIPLGLSPYFLECLSYKYDAPYMALSLFISIFPFLFIGRKKAFVFISIISLLIMYMTYQAASGIYLMIAIMFCFQYWNKRQKTNKEAFSLAGISLLAFALSLIIFKLFIMKPPAEGWNVSNKMFPVNQLIPGILTNIKIYLHYLNSDLGLVWKIIIGLVVIFFLFKSIHISTQKKLISLIVTFLVICLSFILSYGVYYVLEQPLFEPRALFGFGVWLAILGIYIAYNYGKIAKIAALALSWSFFVFAFSYGNALADQMRYTNFRIGILLQDLGTLYPEPSEVTIQLKNSIDYTPSVKLVARSNPVIKRLIHIRLKEMTWQDMYYMDYHNFKQGANKMNEDYSRYIQDYNTLDLPVVMDTYYHTIQSDGTHVLVVLKRKLK